MCLYQMTAFVGIWHICIILEERGKIGKRILGAADCCFNIVQSDCSIQHEKDATVRRVPVMEGGTQQDRYVLSFTWNRWKTGIEKENYDSNICIWWSDAENKNHKEIQTEETAQVSRVVQGNGDRVGNTENRWNITLAPEETELLRGSSTS